MRFLYICCSIFICATFGLQGSEFDLYPSFSDIEPEVTSTNFDNDNGGLNVGKLLTGLGAAAGFGGAVYYGHRFFKRRQRYEESNNDKINATMITIEKENLESTRYKEVITMFQSLFERVENLETEKKEIEGSFAILSEKYISIESIVREIQKIQKTALTEDIVESMIQNGNNDISDSMVKLKKEIYQKMLEWLKEHDDLVLEKIRLLGDEIKKLKNSDSSSAPISKPPIKVPKPKPKPFPNPNSNFKSKPSGGK